MCAVASHGQDSSDLSHSVPVFFRYMSTASSRPTGLCLQTISELAKDGGGCSLDDAGILRIQGTLFNHWVDRVKTMSDEQVDLVLGCIPLHLWDVDLARPGVQCTKHILTPCNDSRKL